MSSTPSTFRMHADVDTFNHAGFVPKVGMEIHFDLYLLPGQFMRVSVDVRPILLDHGRVTGYIRSDGRMYDTRAVRAAPYDLEDPGALGVELLSDSPALNLAGQISYLVTPEMPGDRMTFAPYYISNLPTDSTVSYLANFAPGPGQPAASDYTAAILAALSGDHVVLAAMRAGVLAFLTGQQFTWEDSDDGGYPALGGVPLGPARPWPSGNWNSTAGRPIGILPELAQDFTNAPDGVPGVPDTGGDPWTLTYINNPAAAPVIVDGKYTSNPTAPGADAGYITRAISSEITFLEADFDFDGSGSTTSQVAALIAWHENLTSGARGADPVPDSPCHILFGKTSVGYQIYEGGVHDDVGVAYYPQAVGTERQHAEVALDKDGETNKRNPGAACAYVRDPFGRIILFEDPRIGTISATFACFEPFYVHGDTDERIGFFNVDATSAPVTSPASKALALINEYWSNQEPVVNQILDANGSTAIKVTAAANAENHLIVGNAAAGGAPFLCPNGPADDISHHVLSKGAADVQLGSNTNGLILSARGVENAVNYFGMVNAITGLFPTLYVGGTAANISAAINSKGNGDVYIGSNTNGVVIKAANVADAINFLAMSNAAAGNGPYISSASAVADDVPMNIYCQGDESIFLRSTENGVMFSATALANAVNRLYAVGTAAGVGPYMASAGPPGPVDMNNYPQSGGLFKVNDNPVGVKVAVPSTSSSTGVPSQWAADSSYLYICTAANTWKRTALSSW